MKICVLGHFGRGRISLDGQTVKTKNLSEGIKKYSDIEVVEVDTCGWIKRPFSLIKNTKNACKACDAVIMLPAHRGVQVISYLLKHYGKRYGSKIFYDVVGGWLPEFLKNKRALSKVLRSFNGVWVETSTMKRALDAQGFENVVVVPNFKELTPLTKDELVYPTGAPYKLCTFSRVVKEKGIEDAVRAVEKINAELGYTAYQLDIYGPVDPSQTEWFDELSASFPDFISYKGSVPSEQSVGVLKDYFALLFPTYYEGEGFAGTIIDAYAAGIPVIASDWKYNSDVITDNTGWLYECNDVFALSSILGKIHNNVSLVSDKKVGCIEESRKYEAQKVVPSLIFEFEKAYKTNS